MVREYRCFGTLAHIYKVPYPLLKKISSGTGAGPIVNAFKIKHKQNEEWN